MLERSYPFHLPPFLAPGYAITPEDAAIADSGPVGSDNRERTASPVDVLSLKTLLNSDQLAVFEGWHWHQLFAGGAWFLAPLQFGSTISTCQCRMVEENQAWSAVEVQPLLWEVSLNLEVRPR